MPVLKLARHERFAQAVANGIGLTDAYEACGWKRSSANAAHLRSSPKVAVRIDELLAAKADAAARALGKAIEKAAVDKSDVMRMLLEDRILARQLGQVAPAVRAVELLGKEIGMFVDRKEVRTGPLEARTDAELDDIIRKLAAEAGLGDRAGGEGAPEEAKPAPGLPSVH